VAQNLTADQGFGGTRRALSASVTQMRRHLADNLKLADNPKDDRDRLFDGSGKAILIDLKPDWRAGLQICEAVRRRPRREQIPCAPALMRGRMARVALGDKPRSA
jgi:hypothetical protein